MIIMLKDADFSANNIGQVILPISSFTEAAITASGNMSMTDEQKHILDMFFKTIGAVDNNGIWPKLEKMYLPMICSSLNKSFVNYIDNDVDVTPDSTWLELRNHGVGKIANAAKGDTCVLDGSYVWNWGDKSAFTFNTEVLTTSFTKSGIVNYLSSSAGKWQTLLNVTDSVGEYSQIWGNAGGNDVRVNNVEYNWSSIQPSLKGLSSNGTNVIQLDVKGYNGIKTRIGTAINTDQFDNTPRNLMFAGVPAGGISEGAAAIGAIVLGSYLTEEECVVLGDAFEALWAAFNV